MKTYPVRSFYHMSDDIRSHIAAVRPNTSKIAPYSCREIDMMAKDIGVDGSKLARLCLDYNLPPELVVAAAKGEVRV